ncbi:YeeE/YedE family protein [Granulosicoccus sp.]|nr:DUF6691 family protein [Granulosicoccus sp.]MDB4223336.1 YeeE/YedE family protein [Granulosicoccus sp.]
MRHLIVFLSGLLFSLGLIVSGMINPAKVIGFLDLFGQWDPSLAFVMAGAVAVTFVGFRYVLKQKNPRFAIKFSIPTRTDIDAPLLIGPVLFGLGWGLVGLCPGPALAALTAAPKSTWVFFISMLVGMYALKIFRLRKTTH